MEKMVDTLVMLFRLDKGNRFKKYGYFEGFLSILLNVVLSTLKFVFGTLLNSVSLIADALHSLSDVITSVIVVFGFKISAKPPDEEHPFGHGRAERIVSIVIACLLIVVGFEFFMSGFERFRNPIPIRSDALVIAMLVGSIFIKEFLYQISLRLGRRINSASLKADAFHHRTDAISTVLVLIGFVCFRFGLFSLDGLMGMAVALIIVYAGVSIIIESGNFLIGQAPSSFLVDRIKDTAAQCDGVNDVHHIHVHDYGGQLEVTIHVRLKSNILLDDAHLKASEVEEAIRRCVPGAEVTVHLEPYNEGRRNS
ncbi:MAG: cation diffusion facilitator family transporter [candidate division WOR-3 bacterium]|nr:cation diffusion facilitator family transporter [candidate division WOR-3 bacterium]